MIDVGQLEPTYPISHEIQGCFPNKSHRFKKLYKIVELTWQVADWKKIEANNSLLAMFGHKLVRVCDTVRTLDIRIQLNQ